MTRINEDQRVQSEILEGLPTAVNHRQWFVKLATPTSAPRGSLRALSDQAQKLLDGLLAGYVFEEDGPRCVGTDTAALGWRLGPPGKPVARGVDILTIRDGRVSVARTLIASEPDA